MTKAGHRCVKPDLFQYASLTYPELGGSMTRRDKAGGKTAKARRPKTSNRHNAPGRARSNGQEKNIARELHEANTSSSQLKTTPISVTAS
jgi:hypothetical protein